MVPIFRFSDTVLVFSIYYIILYIVKNITNIFQPCCASYNNMQLKRISRQNRHNENLAFFQTNPLHTPLLLHVWSSEYTHVLTVYAYSTIWFLTISTVFAILATTSANFRSINFIEAQKYVDVIFECALEHGLLSDCLTE